jgi:hypothetical protein
MSRDDATAETLYGLFSEAGIAALDIVPWNVFPWYINRAPTATELGAGVGPLKRVIDLLPELRVVMLHGGSARSGWRRLVRAHPALVPARELTVIETYHTSRQAFWHADPEVRAARWGHLRTSFRAAAQYLATARPT